MKKNESKPCSYGYEEKIKEVELDNGQPASGKAGNISDSKLTEDTDLINPDMSSLDRG